MSQVAEAGFRTATKRFNLASTHWIGCDQLNHPFFLHQPSDPHLNYNKPLFGQQPPQEKPAEWGKFEQLENGKYAPFAVKLFHTFTFHGQHSPLFSP